MKKLKLLFCTAVAVVITITVHAQINRKNTKKSVAYRDNYQRIASGPYSNSAFEIINGTLWAWGSNHDGQLGTGNTNGVSQENPVQIGTDEDWVTIAAGQWRTLGLKSNGTLWAWGSNGYGALGVGTPTNPFQEFTPVQVGSDNKWVSIAVGDHHNLALKSDGTIWAWGRNHAGQLGNGTDDDEYTPIQVGGGTRWASIAVGNDQCYGLKADGTLWAWGHNSFGQLGNGNTDHQSTPIQIGTSKRWVSISPGNNHCLALQADGTLWGWGLNHYGQLGNGTGVPTLVPVQIGTDNDWVTISASAHHNLALKSNGTLWATGDNFHGEIGNGVDSTFQATFIQIGTATNWVSIMAGDMFSFGVKSDGSLWSWGYNNQGQLGNGTFSNQLTPAQINSNNTMTISVSSGESYSLGIRSDGTLWAWGRNDYGQLGDGTNVSKDIPVQIGTDNTWISAVAGKDHSLGIKADGTLWAWGSNYYVQLGVTTSGSQLTPLQIGTDHNWVSVSPGYGSSIALKADGTVWFWGLKGIFGMYPTIITTPTLWDSDDKWVSVEAGNGCTIGLKSNGTLWSHGVNNYGQLGIGNFNDAQYSLVQVGSDDKWISISISSTTAHALKADGTQWGWGYNSHGQVGDGTNVNKNAPVQIGTGVKWINIESGQYHTLGIKVDGTLSAWGRDNKGQLGEGSGTTAQYFPVTIGTDDNWVSTASGDLFSLGLKSNRTQFCSAGYNFYGQLGDDTNTDQNTFVCVNNPGNTLREGDFVQEQELAIANTKQLVAYPNPNTGNFTIQTNIEGNYSIVNEMGQTIKTFNLNSENNYSIDIENIKNGIYFIIGYQNNKIISEKIMINK